MTEEDNDRENYTTFRECLSSVVIERLAVKPAKAKNKRPKGRKNATEVESTLDRSADGPDDAAAEDAEVLAEFSDVRLLQAHVIIRLAYVELST